MATETGTDAKTGVAGNDHLRAVTVTSIAALLGVVAAVASSVLTGDMAPAAAAADRTAQYVLVAVVLVQFPFYRLTGLKTDFGAKDVLFVALVTFSLWFIAWGVLLTSGASF